MNERTMVFNLRGIPAYVKNDFKSYCAKRKITMKSMVMDLMAEHTKRIPGWEDLEKQRYYEDELVGLYMTSLPTDLVSLFHAACAKKCVSMQETLIYLMKRTK